MGQTVLVYGIDLGTTNSCIALIDEHGMPIVKTNSEGQNTTPSVVSYEQGTNNPFVGDVAKEALKSDPTRTVAFIKREIGNPHFKSTCDVADDPVKISAYILKKLVTDSNQSNGLNINNVVITCPAYFGTTEREQTKQAGIAAGLNVLSIINEPTAAALAYGFKSTDNKTILVYDLGGGTFDVSIIQIKNGTMEVLATSGDHRLGGIDWDMALAKYIANEANIKIDFESKSNEKDYLSLKNLLLLNAEIGKKGLTPPTREKVSVSIPYRGETKNVVITRELFDQLSKPLLDQTIEKVNETIEIAKNKGVNAIDEVLLVGGSSRMPQVKRRIDAELNCNAKISDPDMSIAKGAALFAMDLVRPNQIGGMKFKDTSAHCYGVKCVRRGTKDSFFIKNLILAQSPVVCSKADLFETTENGQNSVDISIYEGTSEQYEIDLFEAKLLETHILDLKKGYPKATPIHMTFERTAEGILKIHAEAEGNILEFELKLQGKLNKEDLSKAVAEVSRTNVG